jgi:hypothetical protein
MSLLASLVLVAATSGLAAAQPGTCSASSSVGTTTATGCGSTTCAAGGVGSYAAYTSISSPSDANGVFTVNFKTNQCPVGANSNKYPNGASDNGVATACCVNVNLPVSTYAAANLPKAAPLRGVLGYTVYGANIYGPMEAGFTMGQACTNSKGILDGGVDLGLGYASLEYQCGTAGIKTNMLLDLCGGHAGYHFHESIGCQPQYTVTDSSAHSNIIGFGLDGHGIYGQWESSAAGGTLPTLDACGGHVGDTPAYTFTDSANNQITIPAQTNKYHYHIVQGGPSTIGCFGKNAAVPLAEAKTLYATCGAGFTTYCTSKGSITYDTDCPIFNQQGTGGLYNMNYTPTTACPACNTNCPASSSTGGMTGANMAGGGGNCRVPPGQTRPPGCSSAAKVATVTAVATAAMGALAVAVAALL